VARGTRVSDWLVGAVMRKRVQVRGEGSGNSREVSGVEWWYREPNEANLCDCEECTVARKKPEVGVVRDVRRGAIETNRSPPESRRARGRGTRLGRGGDLVETNLRTVGMWSGAPRIARRGAIRRSLPTEATRSSP
jgi:hypothetical protein